jgi:TatD DNase family protein
MRLIDTHAHLDFREFADDLEAVVERARAAGLDAILTVGTSVEGSRRAIEMAERFEEVRAVVGIHPGNVLEEGEGWLEELERLTRHPRVAAIGETGIDHYRLPGQSLREQGDIEAADTLDETYRSKQVTFFRAQLELAANAGLNVVVHQRAAWAPTMAVLREAPPAVRAVLHCFGGSAAQLSEVIDSGHFVSFTGIATFKNAPDVHAAARTVPGGRYMVETDCPYLAPVPFRGTRCEPAHVKLVAEKIAAIREESYDRVIAETGETAAAFFHL